VKERALKTAKEELARLRDEFNALEKRTSRPMSTHLLSALQAQKAEILGEIKELESKLK
jgi:hypothetical protein